MPRAGDRVVTVGVAVLASVATLVAIGVGAQSPPSTFTFERDVAPIIYSRCAPCHGAGGNAPFSLASYEDVAARAKAMRKSPDRS